MPKVRTFLSAIMSDWLSGMSGPLTVPFAIAAFWLSSTSARISFTILAILAACVTCYRVWAKEYDRAEEERAKNEVAPKMRMMIYNHVEQGSAGSTVSDVFFCIGVVLENPSQVSIDTFSLDIYDAARWQSFLSVDDVSNWEIEQIKDGKPFSVRCIALPKALMRRGDPVQGWLHFRLPDIPSTLIRESGLRIKIDCAQGSCCEEHAGVYAPNSQALMRKISGS